MLSETTLVLSALLAVSCGAEELTFPSGFKFGVASAAYQVEGAWNVSDKGESIWDQFTHRKLSPIAEGHTGDVACDSYHLWKEDIRMVAELGVDFYRISISWPRLLPDGFSDFVSEDGKKYYNNIIDGLLEKGIEPVLTLYHWDLPQKLQRLGGWTNPLVTDWFADYARVAYSLYGDRVKTWITISDAWTICDLSYMTGIIAPGAVNQVGAYICTKNVLMAHAKAWRIYDEEFKPKYKGQVSIANHPIWMEPANKDDQTTADLVKEYQEGRFAHAIYSKEGGWPPVVEKAIADYSQNEGYLSSMLPVFSKEENEFVKGTYDFYALNFYNTRFMRRAIAGELLQPWPLHDLPLFNAKFDLHLDWTTMMIHHAYYPEGLRKQLSWIKNQYGTIPILITENGRGTRGGLEDQERVGFFKDSLEQVLLSIKQDGVNVTGYTAWSIMDGFDWSSGYKTKFGLYEVDFSSPNRTRTARVSARYYASVVRARSLQVPHNYTSSFNIAPQTSKPAECNSGYILLGTLVLLVAVIVIAFVVVYRIKQRVEKYKYDSVKNGDHNGNQNSSNGVSNVDLNGNSNGVRNGHHDNIQNDARNGAANGRNGVDETRSFLTA